MLLSNPFPSYTNKDGDTIREGPRFLYELAKYKMCSKGMEYIGGKFIQVDSEIRSKVIIKKMNDYKILLSINMIEAPLKYIQDGKLQRV